MSDLSLMPQDELPRTIAELFLLYLEAERAATSPDASDQNGAAWCDRLEVIEAAIVAAPAVTPEDVARKVLAVSALGEARELNGPNAPDLWAQLRTLAGVPK